MKFNSDLIQSLRQAQRIVFFTGAGISQESGIPTFREGTNTLWGHFDPRVYASLEGFDENPQQVWQWYDDRRQQLKQLQPNPAHCVIAAWQQHTYHVSVITQNIDGFHQQAGSQTVIELHGSLAWDKCRQQGHLYPYNFDMPTPHPLRCPECDSLLRPDVVWFSEALPEAAYELAEISSLQCDVFISIGCSMEIFPAANLPYNAVHTGVCLIQINPQKTILDNVANYNIHGKAGEVLPALWLAVWDTPWRSS